VAEQAQFQSSHATYSGVNQKPVYVHRAAWHMQAKGDDQMNRYQHQVEHPFWPEVNDITHRCPPCMLSHKEKGQFKVFQIKI